MLLRIEISEIQGGSAFGALLMEDGSAYPLQMPVNTYEDLCTRNFFKIPADVPPAEGECLNYSDIVENLQTVEANYMEDSSGQRVF